MSDETYDPLRRNTPEARRKASEAYRFRGCVICGIQLPTTITIAHLDQQPGNNDADNLAYLCQTHHWMFDAGLYPVEGVRMLRAHWQETNGEASHKARMKNAGKDAAATRKRNALAIKRTKSAKAAWATRRARLSEE